MKKSFYSLVGVNGNAFAVMRYVRDAMRECDCSREDMEEYQAQAMSGDYNNLLVVSMDMLEKLNKMIGCRPHAQFTEPDVIEESRSSKKLKFKKLVEVLKDWVPSREEDSYNEDGSLEYNETIHGESDEDYDMDDEKKAIVWKALDEVVCELWDNYGPFEPNDVWFWIQKAFETYPIEQHSLFKKLVSSKELD